MSRLPISVVIPSIKQRHITLRTCDYFLEICTEVILVDEEIPALSESEIRARPDGFKYVQYRSCSSVDKAKNLIVCKKRATGCEKAKNKFVIHSNHDELYSRAGLESALKHLHANKELGFVAGESIAFRYEGDGTQLVYKKTYKGLSNYANELDVKERLTYHVNNYVPIAHYALWRKHMLSEALQRAIKVHKEVPQDTILDELVFELIATESAKSKSLAGLFWLRNRCELLHSSSYRIRGFEALCILKEKLKIGLKGIDDEKLEYLIGKIELRWPVTCVMRWKLRIKSRFSQIKCRLFSIFVGRRVQARSELDQTKTNKGSFENRLADFLIAEKVTFEPKDISAISKYVKFWDLR